MIGARRFTLILGVTVAAASVTAHASRPSGSAAPRSIARPDVAVWPTLGSTMRTDPAKPAIPAQLRHVQIDPRGYKSFTATRRFADATAFAVTFYSIGLDTSHSPPLYHADKEVAFAMEVIDRRHPDGRRFYLFPPGTARVAALPPGNECAVCHRTRGTFDGTFAHLYPLIAKRIVAGADRAPAG